MIVTQHDGAWVALLTTYTDRDRISDCDVAVLALSVALVAEWRGKLALAKRLKTMIPGHYIRGRRLPTRIIVARVAFCCACEFSEIR